MVLNLSSEHTSTDSLKGYICHIRGFPSSEWMCGVRGVLLGDGRRLRLGGLESLGDRRVRGLVGDGDGVGDMEVSTTGTR